MDKREFSAREILGGQGAAGRAGHDPGLGAHPARVAGWGFRSYTCRTASSFHPVQVVAPNTLPNYEGEVLKLTAGCAVEATGMIVPSPAKGDSLSRCRRARCA